MWGLINLKKDTLLSFEFDYIGKPYENWAIVEKGFHFNYVNDKGDFLLLEWLYSYAESKQLAVFNNGYAKIKYEKAIKVALLLQNIDSDNDASNGIEIKKSEALQNLLNR